MKALILVGGEGTRLRPLTATLPKPLLPIANVAFVERTLGRLAEVGCDEVVLSTCYKSEAFDHLAHRSDMRVRTVVEDEPLGTGGAIGWAARGFGERFLDKVFTDEERRKGTLPRVNIDASGVGFGVWSLLAGEGFTWNDEEFLPHEECIAVAVNTGEAAEDSETYANLRAELHFTAKERLRDGASLPAHDELSEDLRAPKYSLDRYNRILVEPKLKIRARLGRSPDAGDATLLRFYDPPVAPARQPASAGEVLPTENFTAF